MIPLYIFSKYRLFFVPLLLLACSKPGSKPTAGPTSSDQEATQPNSENLNYTSAFLPKNPNLKLDNIACEAGVETPQIHEPAVTIAIDGLPSEWNLNEKHIIDPISESDKKGDIKNIRLSIDGEYLYFLIELREAKENVLELSHVLNFGSLYLDKQKNLKDSSELSLKIQSQRWYKKTNDNFELITSSSKSDIAYNENFIEARLPRNLVDKLLLSPSWWIKFLSFDSQKDLTPNFNDQVGRKYFSALQDRDNPQFYYENCKIVKNYNIPEIRLLRNNSQKTTNYLNLSALIRMAVYDFYSLDEIQKNGISYINGLTFIVTEDLTSLNISSDDKYKDHSVIYLNNSKANISENWKDLYKEVMKELAKNHLYQFHGEVDIWPLKEIFENILVKEASCSKLGLLHVFEQMKIDYNTKNKNLIFSNLFLPSFGSHLIFKWLNENKSVDSLEPIGLESFKDFLISSTEVPAYDRKYCNNSPILSNVNVEDIWSGWVEGEQYSQKFPKNSFEDNDFDKLPNFFEIHHGLNPNDFDSDKDFFSDSSELIYGSSYVDSLSYPSTLIKDNEFSDWHRILASKVIKDLDTGIPRCQGTLDIRYYAAILDKSILSIAVEHLQVSDSYPFIYELTLKFPSSNEIFIMNIDHLKEGYNIINSSNGNRFNHPYDKFCSSRGCEIQIDLNQINQSTQNITLESLPKIRIDSYKNVQSPVLCDQTTEFTPLVKKYIN